MRAGENVMLSVPFKKVYEEYSDSPGLALSLCVDNALYEVDKTLILETPDWTVTFYFLAQRLNAQMCAASMDPVLADPLLDAILKIANVLRELGMIPAVSDRKGIWFA